MAGEYAAVLRSEGLDRSFISVSRSKERAEAFAGSHGGCGGVSLQEAMGDLAIVATAVESLAGVTRALLERGVRHILVEKPGTLDAQGSRELARVAHKRGTRVRVAYNRRYFGSVQQLAAGLVASPPLGAFLDLTEWWYRIVELSRPAEVKARWAIANTVHVVDTAIHLLGPPSGLHPMVQGSLPEHPSGSTFVGSGRFGRTPVAWFGCWAGPGRWDLEVVTEQSRYKLCPMEKLQILLPGRLDWTDSDPEDLLDSLFKPGLFKMVEAFLRGDDCLPDLASNAVTLETMAAIAGYGDLSSEEGL